MTWDPHSRRESTAIVTKVDGDVSVQSYGDSHPSFLSVGVTAEWSGGTVTFDVPLDARPAVGDPVHVVVELGSR